MSGLRALLELAADPDDPIRNPAMALDDRLAEVNRRAHLGDARTLQALEDVGVWVGIGAAILVNALDPATIVLTGYYAVVGHHMRSAIERTLRAASSRRTRAAPASSCRSWASVPLFAAGLPRPSSPSSRIPPRFLAAPS